MRPIKPNMTVHDMAVYAFEYEHPKHGMSDADLDEFVADWLKAGSLERLHLGIRNIFDNDAEAEAFDEAAPQREQDRLDAMEAFYIAFYDIQLEPLEETAGTVAAELSANCRARNHMGKRFVVYDFAVACAKAKGTAKLSRNPTARYTGLADKTARTYIHWLIAHGWLELVKEAKVGGSKQNQQAVYRVVLHEDWVKKYGTDNCLVVG